MEAACVVIAATVIAIMIADLSMPYFEELVGKDFPNKVIFTPKIFPIIGITMVIALLFSGIQPALQLIAYKPIEVLKSNGFMGSNGKGGLRKILVISQFTCSTALIICTIIMVQQLNYVRQSKLGYEKEHIFSFWQDAKKSNLIKNELSGQVGIEAVTLSNRDISNINSRYGDFEYEGMPEGIKPTIYNAVADSDYQQFFGLEIIKGRWFRQEGNDTKSLIINEKAVEVFQLENPIGKWIDFWGRKGTIVGIVKDFHFRSFHHEIQPLIFEQNKDWYNNTYIKTTGKNAAQAIAAAKEVFRKHHPNSVFEYAFLDKTYDNLYKTETRMSQLFSLFALLTIFISSLGIFCLATYTAEKREKEIGIRKVLGASVANIVNLLSLDFLKLVVIALIIATPIAWYFMNDWLQGFAFSIKISWLVFLSTAFITILIAYFTIGFQSLKAALANPASVLKSD